MSLSLSLSPLSHTPPSSSLLSSLRSSAHCCCYLTQRHTHLSSPSHTHTRTHTSPLTAADTCPSTQSSIRIRCIIIIKTFVRFLMAHTTHWNTHVHIWRRHRTHTRRPDVAVNLFSAFFPSWTVLPPRAPTSSAPLVRHRGPSEPSVLVKDGQECSVLFACFFCWGSYWRKPLVNTGRTCKLHTSSAA